jgi:DNA-binding MarR family transcriptional regulator
LNLSSADLARALLISPQAAGSLVKRLSAAGLVEQTTGVDGSTGRLHLTPEGLARLRSAEIVATAAEERALLSLSPNKRRHLEDALLTLLHDTGKDSKASPGEYREPRV